MLKQPGHSYHQPIPAKSVKDANFPYSGRSLAWRFSDGDVGGPYALTNLKAYPKVLARLQEFEGMTRTQLSKSLNYYPTTSGLCQMAKKRLSEINLEGVDALWAFRVSKRQRLWCIRRGDIYALLWWDPEHQVYPMAG